MFQQSLHETIPKLHTYEASHLTTEMFVFHVLYQMFVEISSTVDDR